MATETTNAGHQVTGRCLCGAVKFKARAEKREVGACHCEMCRRWTAGPLLTLTGVVELKFEGEDNIGIYRSSDWGERGFCRQCGSALFWRMQDGTHTEISAGALDSSDGLTFATEVFIDQKPAYYEFANATEKMTGAELFAKFTGDANHD